MKATTKGWIQDQTRVLGCRRRVVAENYFIGRRSQIRGVRLPLSGDWALMIANEIGNVRVLTGVLDGRPADVPLRIFGAGDSKGERIGWSGTGLPDKFRYTAVLPHPDKRAWDLLILQHLVGKIELCRKRGSEPALNFHWMEPLMNGAGVPELIAWRRDGVFDLFLAQADGTILHLPRDRASEKPAFIPPGAPVMDATGMPIELTPPIFPCRVDWNNTGRSDLLAGTGEGYVMLLRDIGDDQEVRYARGRRLADRQGYIKVAGPASATVLDHKGQRFLLVADGEGALWSWPIEETVSYVTADIPPVLKAQGKTEARLDLPVGGYGEIHVTLRRLEGVARDPAIAVRLSDEATPIILQAGEAHQAAREEIFFKAADLTGRQICVRELVDRKENQGAPGRPAFACLESIRIVPVDQPSGDAGASRPRTVVAGIFDTGDWPYRWDTPEEVDEVIGQHQAAGLDRLYFKIAGGACEYPSRIPGAKTVFYPGIRDPERRGPLDERSLAGKERINRPKIAVAACRRRGLQCYGWIRLQDHGEHLQGGQGWIDRFYAEHPEFLEKDPDGNPVPGKLCLGYPKVRAFHLEIIDEVMEFGLDGILMDTLRHLPKVMWGDPIVEEFDRRHGLDMRALQPFDSRVVEFQCEVFTRFLREVRETMKRKNPGAELHVRVAKSYPLMGCDPGRWAREGIADAIIIEHRANVQKAPDIGGLAEVCRGTHCAPGAGFARSFWGAEKLPLDPYRIEIEVAKHLAAGAKSISFYETAEVVNRAEFCRAIRRINNPRERSATIVPSV